MSAVRSPKTIRIATAVFFFISGFGYTTWASRIPSIQRELHLNEAQLGTALFALPVGLLITMPLTARLLRSYSSSRIMLLGALYFSVMLGLLGYAVQYWQFILVLFCFGSSRNLLNVSMNTDGVNVQGLYKKSIITTFHAIWSCAGFAGAALSYFMVTFHVITTWHLLSVSTTLVVLSVCFSPFTFKQKPLQLEKKPIFSLPDKTLINLALICFSSMACENIMYDWSGIYMDKAVHATHVTATAAFVIFMTTLTISRFAGDKIVSRYGVKLIMQYSGVFIVVGFLLAVLFPYVPTTIIGFGLVGIGTSCIVPLCFSEAGKSTTMAKGPAIAAVSTVGYFGFLVVPPMVGFVAQALNLRWSFAIITTLGAVIVWMASKVKISPAKTSI
ncbi:MAG: MFS transporter [Sphingobacteriales bacterium]